MSAKIFEVTTEILPSLDIQKFHEQIEKEKEKKLKNHIKH